MTEGGGEARAVVWPAVGARHRTMHYIALPAGGRTVAHRHRASEAVYYVIRGEGAVEDLDSGTSHPVHAGSVALITPDNTYRIVAAAQGDLACVGGPCPPDPALYAGVSTEGHA